MVIRRRGKKGGGGIDTGKKDADDTPCKAPQRVSARLASDARTIKWLV